MYVLRQQAGLKDLIICTGHHVGALPDQLTSRRSLTNSKVLLSMIMGMVRIEVWVFEGNEGRVDFPQRIQI